MLGNPGSRLVVPASLALVLASFGCGNRTVHVHHHGPAAPPPPFEVIVVASLPFNNASTSTDAPHLARQNLFARLGGKGYVLQAMPDTDLKLKAMGIQAGGQIKGVQPAEMRQKLGADYSLWGTVKEASSMVTGIYNRRVLEVEIVVTDLRTGAVMWTDSDRIVTDDSNLKAKTGLDMLGGVVKGVTRHDLTKEHVALADKLARRFPMCPRQAPAAVAAPAPAPAP